MSVVPALVVLVGGFLFLLGELALRGSNLAVARDRMAEQARLVARSVRDALDQSEPVLDRLEGLARLHGPNDSYAGVAHALADLIKGRPGVTYASISFPDGTFQGAYLDDDGIIRFQDSRVEPDGTHVRRYHLRGRGELALQREERTAYDPRKRGFYALAVTRGTRAWTPPYPFYGTNTTGITRTQPVYLEVGGEKQLHAVITVDFDVNALSSYLRERQLPGMRALLFAGDGTILAYTAGDGGARLPEREDRPIKFTDLSDPLLTSFFEFAKDVEPQEASLGAVQTKKERYLAALAPVSGDPGLAWFMAYLAPEAQFLRELYLYEQRSLWIGASAVLLATVIAFLFARHITRVRQEVAVARAEARQAREAARELGSYRLVACLGKGGMGEVWRAQHRLLAREAAIKLINTEKAWAVPEDLHTRFRREAEALASLRSRNTIELFDYGVAEDGTFFLVMELLDGMDFDSLVQRHGPQPATRVVKLLLQVCSSLAEAHDAGLVHRDIKPANLFICRAADEVDLVKVLDFGLVRAVVEPRISRPSDTEVDPVMPHALASKVTQVGGTMGTPAFMPPEQVLARELDGRADLYALGGVAFFLLAGRLVFPSESPVEQMLAHVHDALPDLRKELGESVPDALVDLIRRCLSKAPADRPASARELARELRAIGFGGESEWSEERAQSWWTMHHPRRFEHLTSDAPRALAVAGTTVTMTPH